MAFKLDNDLLQELGLAALPAHEKQAFLKHILETLEMRVGTTLASKMTDQQLNEFEKLMPTDADTPETAQHKERQALAWLEANFPNYKQVVNDELEKLKAEIKQSAPQILASSQQAPAPQPQLTSQFSPPPYQPSAQPGPGAPAVPQAQPPTSFSGPAQPSAGYPAQQVPQFPPQPPTQHPYASGQPYFPPAPSPTDTEQTLPPQYPSQQQPPQAA